jgi:hypothetical protein
MGQWNPAVGRALAAVRAVTVLGGLRVVVTVDQLAGYLDAPLSSLDIGLRNGPVRAGLLERLIEGTKVGYRHPDAAWTSLPSRIEAAAGAVDFARWYADWLDSIGPAEREAARLTALAVAASAAAAGDGALATRIRRHFRRARRLPRTGRTAAAAARAAPEQARRAEGWARARQTPSSP